MSSASLRFAVGSFDASKAILVDWLMTLFSSQIQCCRLRFQNGVCARVRGGGRREETVTIELLIVLLL